MRIALFSPYIPEHTGGGETYLLRVASELSKDHEVFIAVHSTQVNQEALREKYQNFTQFDLRKVSFITTPLGGTSSFWQKLWWTMNFDILYYQTDGSLFFSLARKNILHIQVPFKQPKTGFLERLKLRNWQIKNTNSEFTRQVVSTAWQTPIQFVHHPAVDIAPLGDTTRRKEKIILSVGRFFRQLHSKRQDVLVQLFKQLDEQHHQVIADWQLVLIGGVEDEGYAQEVAKSAQGLNVTFVHQAQRDELISWYQRASIYWHATGFGVDPHVHPEKMEHFGISTVEAMAAGAVPVVYAQGGQPEILGDDLRDWGWNTLDEAMELTIKLIKDQELAKVTQQIAKQRARRFDGRHFAQVLQEMINA